MPLAPLSASNEEHAFRLIAASLRPSWPATRLPSRRMNLSSPRTPPEAEAEGKTREHVDVVEAAPAVASMAAASVG